MQKRHGDNLRAVTKSKELEVHQALRDAQITFEYQHYLPFRGCGLESETAHAFADFALATPWGYVLLEVDEEQRLRPQLRCAQGLRHPYSFLFVYYQPRNEMFFKRFEERFVIENADGSGALLGQKLFASSTLINAKCENISCGPALPGHSGEDHAAGGGHQGGQRSPGGRHRRGAGLRARKQRRLHLGAAGLQGGRQRPDSVRAAVGRGHFLKIAAAFLNAVNTAALDAALLGKADASALASLLSTVDGLPLEVDTKIANALLGLATEAFVAAQLASRDASITALQASKADTALLASYATNAALSASETTLQSALDAILAELAALQLSGSGVVNAPAWAGFATWELLRGSSVVRNLHFVAPLSAALANGDDTLSVTADCYSTAGMTLP